MQELLLDFLLTLGGFVLVTDIPILIILFTFINKKNSKKYKFAERIASLFFILSIFVLRLVHQKSMLIAEDLLQSKGEYSPFDYIGILKIELPVTLISIGIYSFFIALISIYFSPRVFRSKVLDFLFLLFLLFFLPSLCWILFIRFRDDLLWNTLF